MAVASFEQNFIRQLQGNHVLPLVLPNRSGLMLCVVGASRSSGSIIEQFMALFDEISNGASNAFFTKSVHECPKTTKNTLVFEGEDYASSFVSLIEQKRELLGFDTRTSSFIQWSRWEGAKTAFMVDENSTLHTVTTVWLNVPEAVQNALTLKALFQIGAVSQPVEWVGPFFSIAQTVEPSVQQTLIYSSGESELSIDHYLKWNAAGLCMSDLINLKFLLKQVKEGATPNQALFELERTHASIKEEILESNILERFPSLVDNRCI